MANKAVIVGVGASIGAYSLMEHYNDKKAERERQQIEEAQRERKEEMDRLFEERMRKESKSFKSMKNAIDDEMIGKEFNAKVFSHLEEMLSDLVVKVGKEASCCKWNNHVLNLPLIGNEYDEEELTLAAAFALGDCDIIVNVLESLSKRKLGIGLKKFSKRSIMNIINVFESIENPDIDQAGLYTFTVHGVFVSKLRGKKPYLISPNNVLYSDKLNEWGEKFGIHVSRSSSLQMVSNFVNSTTGRVKFRFEKIFHAQVRGDGVTLRIFIVLLTRHIVSKKNCCGLEIKEIVR